MVYAPHFDNDFQFDDQHTIVENHFIRDLKNIPRFFYDATTFSTFLSNQSYRPLVSTSLAIDYWIAGGLNQFYFHLSTFFWYLVYLLCSWQFLRFLVQKEFAERRAGFIVALFLVAFYALHPVCAETINYIIQRGELYASLGMLLSLFVYARFDRLRAKGYYLLAFFVGAFAKQTALVFAPLLFVYVLLVEKQSNLKIWEKTEQQKIISALRVTLPAWILCAFLFFLQATLNIGTFATGGASLPRYLITQPYVIMIYIKNFFLPTNLSVDTDLQPFESLLNFPALAGVGFLVVLLFLICFFARSATTRLISFGLSWFLIALLPTSLVPLAEVMNNHRMFFPFLGLIVAGLGGANYFINEAKLRPRFRQMLIGLYFLGCLSLPAYAYQTYLRNEVWHNRERLWLDVIQKSPSNGRALMTYGAILLSKNQPDLALSYFQKAKKLNPAYWSLEINLGKVYAALGNNALAEEHFLQAIRLASENDRPYLQYARWLYQVERPLESRRALEKAVKLNPTNLAARELLLGLYFYAQEEKLIAGLVADSSAKFPHMSFEKYLKLQPTLAEQQREAQRYFKQAEIYKQAEDMEAAQKALNIAKRLHSENAQKDKTE